MARRSARLHQVSAHNSSRVLFVYMGPLTKANPQRQPADTPAASDNSLTTEQEGSTLPKLPDLPDLPELPEPNAIKTPRKAAAPAKAAATPTPHDSKSHTPKNRTPIKPAGEEMHPALHHASTAKILDEARWLGFQSLGAHTAPPKAAAARAPNDTPSKTPVPASASNMAAGGSSPDFHFRFKAPKQADAALSPSTRSLLHSTPAADSPGGSRALFGATEFSTKADMPPERKVAAPKGKMARFNDAHMAQFKKMDSIANHPSAFRADPSRFKPVGQPLDKTPAKPEASKSKRTQSTVRLVPPTREREGRPGPSAKRVKRTEADDAATTRPASRDGGAEPASVAPTPTPARKITSQTALPRLAARLMTPTKSSMARSQSVKVAKSTSMISSLPQSPSTRNVFSPTNVARTMRDTARDSMRQASLNLQRVRSILRTPSRKFSDDPQKVAAGTHMSPPPAFTFEKAFPPVPATAPAKKHVNFSSSTLDRAAHDELGKSPSPMKFRAGSEVPAGAVVYPTIQPGVQYPDLPRVDESPVASPSRRLMFGGESANHPRQFSFESSKRANFGPASTGTVRMVRQEDVSTLVDGTKRKLDSVPETSDKENDEPAEDDMRSRKKIKPTPAAPKTPTGTSKLPRRTPGRTPGRTPSRGSAISKSRLAFLATPKRSKA